MLGLVIGGLYPIVVKPQWHRSIAKPRDQIPVQINRIQFDMGNRMQQCGAPCR